MLDGDINQVAPADELDDRPLQQEAGGQDGNEAEDKRPHQAVPEGPGPLMLGQPLGQQAKHEGVIDRQHPFEHDQQQDDADIGGVQVLAEDVDGGEREKSKSGIRCVRY